MRSSAHRPETAVDVRNTDSVAQLTAACSKRLGRSRSSVVTPSMARALSVRPRRCSVTEAFSEGKHLVVKACWRGYPAIRVVERERLKQSGAIRGAGPAARVRKELSRRGVVPYRGAMRAD